MANTNLSKAKSAKNDEFYTQYADIQKAAYLAKFGKPGTYDLNASAVLNIDGILEKTYHRLFIRHRKQVRKGKEH